jgi:hypothetical protein
VHVSIRTYRVGTGSIDGLMHRVDRDFAEAMAREPGFIAYQAVQTGERTVASISSSVRPSRPRLQTISRRSGSQRSSKTSRSSRWAVSVAK